MLRHVVDRMLLAHMPRHSPSFRVPHPHNPSPPSPLPKLPMTHLVVRKRELLELGQAKHLLRDLVNVGAVEADPLEVCHVAQLAERHSHREVMVLKVQALDEPRQRHGTVALLPRQPPIRAGLLLGRPEEKRDWNVLWRYQCNMK